METELREKKEQVMGGREKMTKEALLGKGINVRIWWCLQNRGRR